MKTFKIIALSLIATLVFASCSNDDDTPEPVNEEEVITTVIVNLVANGNTVTLTSRDADGDGPNDPVVTVSGNLTVGTTYAGTVQFLNETESPAEDITEEVEEESDEHQVFFLLSSALDGTVAYGNFDNDGNPLGTEFSLLPNAAGTGNFALSLRHEPKKPNDGTLDDAGGETDIFVAFEVTFE
ncbi:type 1 periplasmic binding fold superfamily protein [Rasiella rasia]|uniref:Type 1 periplasmic binding fold superfamily protein n=1 Tax=Rasiella rasia TaxID=2744027 RepID=A0A6G6GJI8_9FLAO|nr:type 1 periplasmic binding fold superfamily protein [Rasiella rasia]QIE58583.1 type 1 periplasmic binding fold superfamily protein [Rasiella rasia]